MPDRITMEKGAPVLIQLPWLRGRLSGVAEMWERFPSNASLAACVLLTQHSCSTTKSASTVGSYATWYIESPDRGRDGGPVVVTRKAVG